MSLFIYMQFNEIIVKTVLVRELEHSELFEKFDPDIRCPRFYQIVSLDSGNCSFQADSRSETFAVRRQM